MTLSLGFDMAFAVLLVITIGYAIVLNRKLGNLRRHKKELERLALTFSQSTARADDSIQRLKSSTDVLQKGIEKAQGLRGDLSFLIDRGTLVADRLEDGVRGTRNRSEDDEMATAKRSVEGVETISDAIAARKGNKDSVIKAFTGALGEIDEDHQEQKSQAERDLIEALRQVR